MSAPLHLPSDRRQYTLLRDAPPFEWPDPEGFYPDGAPVFVLLRDLVPGTAMTPPSPRSTPRPRPPRAGPRLRGIYEFERDGRRFVGLLVADDIKFPGDTLLKALDLLAPGVSRALDCRLPSVRRALSIVRLVPSG